MTESIKKRQERMMITQHYILAFVMQLMTIGGLVVLYITPTWVGLVAGTTIVLAGLFGTLLAGLVARALYTDGHARSVCTRFELIIPEDPPVSEWPDEGETA